MIMHIIYKKIDTVVTMIPTHPQKKMYIRTQNQKVVNSVRIILFNTELSDLKLQNLSNLDRKIKDTDLEYNFEIGGKIVQQTHNIIVDRDFNPVYNFRDFDYLTKPDGSILKRPHKIYDPNVNNGIPVRITSQYYKPETLIKRFIFRKSYYLIHSDGLTYQFLYNLAFNLVQRQQFVRIQAYQKEKVPGPLVLYRGGLPYPVGFLEGRIDGDKYALILHLSDTELKLPTTVIEDTNDQICDHPNDINSLFCQDLEQDIILNQDG